MPAGRPLLYLAIPQFGANNQDKKDKCEEFSARLDYHFKPHPDDSKQGFTILTKLCLREGKKLAFHENWLIPFPEDSVKKGLAIRLAIINFLWIADTVYLNKAPNDLWFIMADGTGAFKPTEITKIINKLKDPNIDVVLGKRTSDDWTTDPERILLENFEKYLLEKKYGVSLKDCQCGLWGLKRNAFHHIALTAPSYELEFDLTSSVIVDCTPRTGAFLSRN